MSKFLDLGSNVLSEETGGASSSTSMALLPVAMLKPSACPTLGLFIKSQKEGREKKMCAILGVITAHSGSEILGGNDSSLYLLRLGQWFNAPGLF